MKNYNNAIGNRTRDFPACSAVPQPTAPPPAPIQASQLENINLFNCQGRNRKAILRTRTKSSMDREKNTMHITVSYD